MIADDIDGSVKAYTVCMYKKGSYEQLQNQTCITNVT